MRERAITNGTADTHARDATRALSPDRDYVLGTDEVEIARLGLQHDAWRPIVLDCWNRAGLAAGSRVIDLGAGPGCATVDLAGIVGPTGTVTAVERSGRFVEAGRAAARRHGLTNIDYRELDLMTDPLPDGAFDAAWCRWVCSFVDDPDVLIAKLADVLRPGGIAVFHEYVDYASWRFSPQLPLMDAYIRHVMASWRASGGEPDIAMHLPPLLRRHGFTVREAVPRVFCVRPGDDLWMWISTFVMSNCDRLVELGTCDADWIASVRAEFVSAETDSATLLLTPMVLELIAELPE